jgi:secondary thiamine-phosphate synthase enzyme
MEMLSSVSVYRHASLHVSTVVRTQFIDLTDRLERLVAESGLATGLVNVQTVHTTTAVVVNEHEPLLLEDFKEFLEALAPSDCRYRHDDTNVRTVNLTAAERPNGHAHCRALVLPTSVGLNIANGRLRLGTWQRVFFVELDGPRDRELSVLMCGEGRA